MSELQLSLTRVADAEGEVVDAELVPSTGTVASAVLSPSPPPFSPGPEARNLFGEAERIAARAAWASARRQYGAIFRAFGDWLAGELGRPPVVGDVDADVIAAYARHLARWPSPWEAVPSRKLASERNSALLAHSPRSRGTRHTLFWAKFPLVRREWQPEELIVSWTLVDRDWELVANKSGATRLGFALLLKFFELEGRFPGHAGELPPAAVQYVASQVKVSSGLLVEYVWSGRRSSITGRRSATRRTSGSRRGPMSSDWRAGWQTRCARAS